MGGTGMKPRCRAGAPTRRSGVLHRSALPRPQRKGVSHDAASVRPVRITGASSGSGAAGSPPGSRGAERGGVAAFPAPQRPVRPDARGPGAVRGDPDHQRRGQARRLRRHPLLVGRDQRHAADRGPRRELGSAVWLANCRREPTDPDRWEWGGGRSLRIRRRVSVNSTGLAVGTRLGNIASTFRPGADRSHDGSRFPACLRGGAVWRGPAVSISRRGKGGCWWHIVRSPIHRVDDLRIGD